MANGGGPEDDNAAAPEVALSFARPPEVPPVLTEAQVLEAVARAVPGANSLHNDLREVFALNDASSTLRLR